MEYRIVELLKEIKNLITNKPKPETWLDLNQAADYSNCSKTTLRRNIKSNSLVASNTTGKYLIKRSSLEQWLNGSA